MEGSVDDDPGERSPSQPESPQPSPGPAASAPPISGWQLPAEMDPSWRSRPWPRRHWRPLLFLGLVAVVVVILVGLFSSSFKTINDLTAGSNGQITGVNETTTTNGTSFSIYAAVGVGPAEGVQLACTVVKPILARDGYATARFAVLDRAGDILATELTDCGSRTPSPIPVTLVRSRDFAG